MTKSLFTLLFLLGTVSYLAQGFPEKIGKRTWSQNNERTVKRHLTKAGFLPQERNAPRSTVRAEDDCKCGRKNIERIVGGQDATSGEWCWQAKLMLYPPVDDGTYLLCGGSVINSAYILSAAHCFYGHEDYSIQLYLGAYHSYYDDDQVPYDVESIIEHQDYDPTTKANDVTLLKLADTIAYTPRICSVCLPTSHVEDGAVCTVTGWGDLESGGEGPEVLQEVEVNIVSQTDCAQSYGNLDDSQLCAAAPGKDSCQGDSGGPLVHENSDGVWDLVGVVSAGIGCADPNYPGLYADVYELLSWIETNTEGSEYCSRD